MTGLLFQLMVGDGSNFDGKEINPNNVGDNDDAKGIGARLRFTPSAIDTLGLGFSLNVNDMKQTSWIETVPEMRSSTPMDN